MANPTKILMVDDDPHDIFLTKIALKSAPFSVEFTGVNSGEDLFNHITNNGIGSVDALLLDVNMPRQNGLEILEKLNKYPDFDKLNVIMFSTSGRDQDKTHAKVLGAKDYMIKPADAASRQMFLDSLTSILYGDNRSVA